MLLLVILLTILYPSVFFVSGRRAPFGISCDASLVVANSLMRMKTFTFFYFKVFDTSMCSRLICKGILFSLTCISGASGISAGDVTSEMENALYSLSKQASSLQPGYLSLRASLPWIGSGGLWIFSMLPVPLFYSQKPRVRVDQAASTRLCCNGWGRSRQGEQVCTYVVLFSPVSLAVMSIGHRLERFLFSSLF